MVDSTKCVVMAHHRTGHTERVAPTIATMTAKYPALAEGLKQAVFTPDVQVLFKQGEAMMAKEPKDWKLGQDIFGKLAAMAPELFIVQVQAAACFTYGSGHNIALLRCGEAYAGAAIGLDPTAPAGYGILARNLTMQNRLREVVPAAETLLQCRDENAFKDVVVDGFRCLRQAHQKLGAPPAVIDGVTHQFKVRYPALAPRLDQVVNETGCVLM